MVRLKDTVIAGKLLTSFHEKLLLILKIIASSSFVFQYLFCVYLPSCSQCHEPVLLYLTFHQSFIAIANIFQFFISYHFCKQFCKIGAKIYQAFFVTAIAYFPVNISTFLQIKGIFYLLFFPLRDF